MHTLYMTDHSPEHSSARSRIRSVRALPETLFPFLPGPARLACIGLAGATVVADLLAWVGNLGGEGIASGLRPVPLFGAVMLCAFTVAAAAVPRVVYAWLHRQFWSADSPGDRDDFTPQFFSFLGAHAPLGGLLIAVGGFTHDAPSRLLMAAIACIGGFFWAVHEGLLGYRRRENARAQLAP